MADNTDRFGLNTYSQGDTNWDHTDTVQTIDELAIERGAAADRPASGDYDDELYLATDQQILYRWDGDAADWIVEGVGSETDPLPKVWANEIDVEALEAGSAVIDGQTSDYHWERVAQENTDGGVVVDLDITVNSREVLIHFGGGSSNGVPLTDGSLTMTIDNITTSEYAYITQSGSTLSTTTGDTSFEIISHTGQTSASGLLHLTHSRSRRCIKNVSIGIPTVTNDVIDFGRLNESAGTTTSIQIKSDVPVDASSQIVVYTR